MSKGKINQVIGPVVDFKFDTGQLPDQGHAIELKDQQGKKLVFEVFQHLGDDVVRTVAMDSTDGLVRGMEGRRSSSPSPQPGFQSLKPNLQSLRPSRLSPKPGRQSPKPNRRFPKWVPK